jgi:hypothetical protein
MNLNEISWFKWLNYRSFRIEFFGSDEYQEKKNTENHNNNNNRAADVAGATRRAPMSL